MALLAAMAAGCRGPAGEPLSGAPGDAAASAPAAAAELPAGAPAPSESAPPPPPRTITISGVGDCTLGGDFQGKNLPTPFDVELASHGDDLRYPFSGVLDILRADDLTVANLETTLTRATAFGQEGAFHFRGKPGYARILAEGSVEVANLANNHMDDFGARGQADTIKALRAAGVGAARDELVDRQVVRGVEIVNLGYHGGYTRVASIARKIAEHKRPNNLVIVSFHWGTELETKTAAGQRALGRAAIAAGADLVLGTHPHVIQAIEEYAGRHVVYSLGNFVFGGNVNPADKDAIIYQETFGEQEGRFAPIASRVIPVRISTDPRRNDYRPVLLEGEEAARVLARVKAYSEALPRPPGAAGSAR